VHTYVCSRAGVPELVLLLRVQGRRLQVLNEFIAIEAAALERFLDFAFARMPQIDVISFKALRSEAMLAGRVIQRYSDRADIEIALPSDTQSYAASLGRSTRSTVRTALNRLQRQPGYRCLVARGVQIDHAQLERLVALSNARLREQGRHSYNDAGMVRNYLALAHAFPSFLLTLWIDDELCGGAFNVHAGDGCFGFVNAFDSRFSHLRAGFLASYLSICTAIEDGARRFQMGWQRYDYKYSLGGRERPTVALQVYRSPVHLLNDRSRRIKAWMTAPMRRNSIFTRAAVAATHRLRAFMRRLTPRH
jgi:CelD/BcsL family acetyltransferase involved in cellulose biosynthesis